ncbi:MAG TPA: inositol-3-phosphate synthase [Tepidisphaeraceae bacterium]|nr:inositol-3-phosphate synthase [Tepidisphaeraceae bacterium]
MPSSQSQSKIRIAVAGVGNCASSLVQGIAWYATSPDRAATGLAFPRIGGFGVDDLEIVAAFDVDRRKVGRPLEEAVFAAPNNTQVFCRDLPRSGVVVQMGEVLDGVAEHMNEYPPAARFEPASDRAVDVARALRDSAAEILVNYLPVGSQRATEHYALACLEAGVSLVNCIPVFIASDPAWAQRFTEARIPIVGDDIKAQVGATITHRTLARLFVERGVHIEQTYQLNTGGNTDFLNMLARERLHDKKISKTDAVQSQLDVPLDPERIHIGPSDYVPFLKDNKVCFLRLEGTGFGGVPLHLELRLSVEDSPNSAGSAVDAIRCCKLARDAGLAGPVLPACAWSMKHPPQQMTDDAARQAVESFMAQTVLAPAAAATTARPPALR